MEQIITISFFAIMVAVISVLLKQGKMPSAALLVSLAAGILIFLLLLPKLGQIFFVLRELGQKVQLNYSYVSLIFKLLAIAYITEFAAQLCRDAGEGALSMKIEMGGKIGILMLSMPVMTQVLQTVLDLL